jgi:putative ABC transport system permease protein
VNTRETLRFAWIGVTSNKLRSSLTILGILIGVASVIVLVAVGQGSSASVQASINKLGTNSLTVLKGGSFGPFAQSKNVSERDLTTADAAAFWNRTDAPDVKSASPVKTAQVTCTVGSASHSSSITGTWASYFEASNSVVGSGRYFTNSDVTEGRRVAVIGQTVVKNLFGTVQPVGATMTCSGVPFTVVGVLDKKGSTGFQDGDDTIIAPLSTVQRQIAGYGSLSSITVQARSSAATTNAQTQVQTILDARHGITDPTKRDYQVLNQASLLSASSSSSKTFTVLLAAVAAISLLVGGIGITNIMLVTVTERTREIGIRKAIGASRGAVLGQFLVEATFLSILGGVVGVLLGLVVSQFSIAGVQPVVVPASVALAFLVSVVIGLVFGGFPANRAASLRPIDALRHE